jgi:multidrug efflux system membrane fusion protein
MRFGNPIALAALISVAVAAWLATGTISSRQTGTGAGTGAAPAAPAPPPPTVRTSSSVAAAFREEVRLLGQTAANRRVELRAEVDGRVVELPVERGQRVERAMPLVKLSTDDRAARLREASAVLHQRQIEYEAARALSRSGYRAETSLAEAAARFDGAKAVVSRMEIELARTTIAAPFQGVLETRPVELGSYVKAGDPVASIVDLNPLRIVGFVSERDVQRIDRQAPAEVRLPPDAGNPGGRAMRARWAFLATVADTATRTFRAELELDNADFKLVEGLTVELRLSVGERKAHKFAPSVLTLAENGQVGIKLVDEGGVVRFQRAQIVDATRDVVWLGGLPERIRVIAVGQEFVRDGQTVTAVDKPLAP